MAYEQYIIKLTKAINSLKAGRQKLSGCNTFEECLDHEMDTDMISVLGGIRMTAEYIDGKRNPWGDLFSPEKNIFWEGRDEIFPEGKEFSQGR